MVVTYRIGPDTFVVNGSQAMVAALFADTGARLPRILMWLLMANAYSLRACRAIRGATERESRHLHAQLLRRDTQSHERSMTTPYKFTACSCTVSPDMRSSIRVPAKPTTRAFAIGAVRQTQTTKFLLLGSSEE